jgi:hypothetical protein
MERYTKVITPNARPITEGATKGNTNTRPEGPKPTAEARPQGNSTAPVSTDNNPQSSGSSQNSGTARSGNRQ